MNEKPSLSVIFLTLNEEFHIGDAIDNVKSIAEEIFVVDSLSCDRTVDIALQKGATVIQRPFTNFGDQWNFALTHLPVKTRWTMKMDPDERLTDALKAEITDRLDRDADLAGYAFDRILFFMGKPMRAWRDHVLRIWRSGKCRFTDVVVNEHPVVEGKIGDLRHTMDHFDSRDLHQWVEKQNRYTTLEALRRFRGEKMAAEPRLFGTALERHMYWKRLFFHLPGRYQLMFLQLYFLKGLWREGVTGMYCIHQRIWSRRLIEAKLKEMRNTGREILLPPNRSQKQYHPAVAASPLQQELFPEGAVK